MSSTCSNMDATRGYTPSETNQKEKDRHPVIHVHAEPKTWHKQTYLWNRSSLTDIENGAVVSKGGG